MTSVGDPLVATFPRSSRTIVSAKRATRFSWWLTRSTASPERASDDISSKIAISCATSRNVVGSSRTRAGDFCASARDADALPFAAGKRVGVTVGEILHSGLSQSLIHRELVVFRWRTPEPKVR